jgi:hypothetical protein
MLLRVPPTEPPHKATHVFRALAVIEGPTAPPCTDLVGNKQIRQLKN